MAHLRRAVEEYRISAEHQNIGRGYIRHGLEEQGRERLAESMEHMLRCRRSLYAQADFWGLIEEANELVHPSCSCNAEDILQCISMMLDAYGLPMDAFEGSIISICPCEDEDTHKVAVYTLYFEGGDIDISYDIDFAQPGIRVSHMATRLREAILSRAMCMGLHGEVI